MAVVVSHKKESITSLLMRFQQQVIKEGILKELMEQRFFVTKGAQKRKKRMDFSRLLKRRKRINRKKIRTVTHKKPKIV